tara:strand:- start:867 stop:1778 length:912 start_codon:yes stop_codon:yes gene_type:complete
MSETLNVNVLVAAKDEYTKQLINTIKPGFYDIIKNVYTESQKNNIRRTLSYSNFQKELKGVPNWTSFKLEEKLHGINSKFPYLMDLVTAIFVSHVKILACVRLKSEDKSVKIKVPNLNTFLHKILIKCSECIYYNPEMIHDDKVKILEIIVTSINDTIANQIPIEYILNEYLSGVFDEEETRYPEKNDIVEPDEDFSDEELYTDVEAGEKKNIPIIPIQKPINKQIIPGTLKDDMPFNREDPSVNKKNLPDEIEEFSDLKNNKYDSVKVNKQENIDDASDDDFSDEDEGEEETENDKQEPTLF